MRRAALAVWVAAVPAVASASPWTVTAEGGGEYDSNVERVETGPGLTTSPVASPVLRFGARATARDKLFGGGYSLDLSDLTRIVSNQDASVDNVTVLGGAARWLHPLGDGTAAAGADISAIDALPITDSVGDRTFVDLAANGVLVLRGGDDRRLTLAVGGHSFTYQPDHTYDFDSASASARFDAVLWKSPMKTETLELAVTAGFEPRSYNSTALVDMCPQNAPPAITCSAGTSITRRDRYQRVGFDVTYVGHAILSAGYQLTVIDSNSYGQSLARHRVMASGTVAFGKTFATLLAIVQIDQYLDGLLIASDPQMLEVTNVEDENRSTLQLRLARKLTDEWSLESRVAYWRNILGDTSDLAFERTLVYAGVVYSK